jgi:pyruvate,water dikinase
MQTGMHDITADHLGECRERIKSDPLPPSIRHAVEKAWAGLGDRVAVRSSMSGEDSCSASFAGLLETYLNIGDEQSALTAVQECLASSFNWRLWKYQQRQEQSLRRIRKNLALAVIIQDMVDAQVSGVAFSADPNTGVRDVVIEAVRGLGDSLVQGCVVPYRYILDEAGNLEEVTPQAGSPSLLPQKEVLDLAEKVREIAATAQCGQDIEWAWDGSDFLFLQSRPITALPDQRMYSARLVADMSPGLIKPLLWSTKSRSMVRCVFGRICRELLGPHQIDFATYIKRIHSRTYADMTAFGDFLVRLGLPPNFFEMITRHEKSKWRQGLLRPNRIPLLFRLMRFAFRHFRADGKIETFVRSHSRELEPFRQTNWEAIPEEGLTDRFDLLLDLHAQTQWYIFIGPLNMTLRYRLLSRVLRDVSGVVNPGNLLRGSEALQALVPNEEIKQMGRMAQELDKQAIGLMLQGAERELEEKLEQTESGRRLRRRFDAFISRFGFLSANGSDFATVSWKEDPSPVWRSIGRQAVQMPSWNTERVRQNREREVHRIRKELRGLRRFLFDRLLRSTVRYMELRESTSLLMSEETYLMRCALLNIAHRLRNRELIDEPSDVFYLYYDELRLLLQEELAGAEAGSRISNRKAEIERDAKIEPPNIITGQSPLLSRDSVHEECDYLEGIPGSPGKIQGEARVVRDPRSVAMELKPRDILIVPFTDVGWTPILPGIGGIVAETGGQLSHTSIIAREYGLPSVVSVRDATRRIQEGQPVTVDGNRGRVYLKHI